MTYLCYVDETGDGGLVEPSDPASTVCPAIVVLGVIVSRDQLRRLTEELLELKFRYFGSLIPGPRFLDAILTEIKAKNLRSFTPQPDSRYGLR